VLTGGFSAGFNLLWDAVTGKSEPPPLTVFSHVEHDRRSAFLVQKPASALRPVPGETSDPARVRWAQRNGGFDAFSTNVRVVVQGRGAASVVLLGLEVDVITRRPPATGTLIGPAGAGGIGVRYFDVDLDQPAPEAELGLQSEPRPGERPIDFPYKVSFSDPEVFLILAHTQKCDCRWIAKLHWESGGKSGTTLIRNGDQPFRTGAGGRARDILQPDENGRLRRRNL
jgi:hypothetical protein